MESFLAIIHLAAILEMRLAAPQQSPYNWRFSIMQSEFP
jgi:hypothetical protein